MNINKLTSKWKVIPFEKLDIQTIRVLLDNILYIYACIL